jgi:hemolysin activation/secretion protein
MGNDYIRIGRPISVNLRGNFGVAGGVRICLIMAVACVALATASRAQSASQPGYDPRQTEKRFENQQSSRDSSGRPRLPTPQFGGAGEGDTKPLFVLRSVSIAGAAAIVPERLVTTYQPYLGKRVSQSDLAAVASAISDVYRAEGFHLSRAVVPPQDVQNGELRIQVIEGSITDLTLKGDGAEQFGVRAMLAAVLAERPSRLATLERQLLLINGRPGVRLEDTALEEIGAASGQFRLVLTVKAWHVFTSFGLDNFGSSSVGPWQSYGTAAFNSYFTPGDSLVFNLATTPGDPRQLGFGRVSYETPIGVDGARIGATAYYSEVRPGDFRRLFGDNIRTESFELRGSIVPLQSQKTTLTLTAAAGFTNASEGDVFGPVYADRIRPASLTSDYRLQDDFGGVNYLTINVRQGLDVFGASQRGDDFLSRGGASARFTALNFWFTRYQTVSDAWSLKLAAASQTASGPLFASQQFFLGGMAFGRGYGSAELSGDNGLAGSVELRFDQKTRLPYLNGYQLYAFVDSGVAWNDGFQLSDGLSLTSAGVGARFFLLEGLQADIGVAAPLSYRAPDNSTRNARVLFSLTNALKLCPVRATTRCL